MVTRVSSQECPRMAAAKGEEVLADVAFCPEFGNGLVLPGDTELKDSPGDTLSSIFDSGIVIEGVVGVHNVVLERRMKGRLKSRCKENLSMRILEGVRCALTAVFEDIVLGFKLRRPVSIAN